MTRILPPFFLSGSGLARKGNIRQWLSASRPRSVDPFALAETDQPTHNTDTAPTRRRKLLKKMKKL
ncbi:MAG TPA: hypothetical protein PLM52_09855 [Tabrizicola sp.]|nr:hypothetical protein [Tabrizicola sp.]